MNNSYSESGVLNSLTIDVNALYRDTATARPAPPRVMKQSHTLLYRIAAQLRTEWRSVVIGMGVGAAVVLAMTAAFSGGESNKAISSLSDNRAQEENQATPGVLESRCFDELYTCADDVESLIAQTPDKVTTSVPNDPKAKIAYFRVIAMKEEAAKVDSELLQKLNTTRTKSKRAWKRLKKDVKKRKRVYAQLKKEEERYRRIRPDASTASTKAPHSNMTTRNEERRRFVSEAKTKSDNPLVAVRLKDTNAAH